MDKLYLIKDYTEVTELESKRADFHNLKISVVSENELWAVLDTAKTDKLQIAVYEVGKCLLDWS